MHPTEEKVAFFIKIDVWCSIATIILMITQCCSKVNKNYTLCFIAKTAGPIKPEIFRVEGKWKKENDRKGFIACASRFNNDYHIVYLSYHVWGNRLGSVHLRRLQQALWLVKKLCLFSLIDTNSKEIHKHKKELLGSTQWGKLLKLLKGSFVVAAKIWSMFPFISFRELGNILPI